jgi:NDP-sugar pyrophosphorylase family protein
LPLVDAEGVLAGVVIRDGSPRRGLSAVVMAGGQGRRLGAVTKDTPKPLVPVGDSPMLEHIMSGLESAGVGTIYVAVHHMGDQIAEFVNDRSSAAQVRLLHEDEPLGTAGSLANIDPPDGPILVVNADVLTSADFAALVDFHDRHGYDATIGVAQHAVKIPYGVIRHNEEGRFLGIDEKPTVTNFVAAGIYYLAPAVPNLLRPGQRVDMPELLNLASEAGLKIGLFPIHEYWLDVGHPDDLESARQHHVAGDARSRDTA